MHHTSTLPPRFLLLLVALGTLAACGGTQQPETMQTHGATPDYGAPPDRAHVIFVRHTSAQSEHDFVVLDSDGGYVATLRGNMHTVVDLAPGEHTFYVLAENAERLRATLEAGRTYIVETRPHAGFAAGDGVVVEAVPIERLAEVRGWVSTTSAMVPDQAQGDAWVAQRKRQIDQKIASAEASWLEQDVFWRRKHTVQPTHGLTASQLGL